MKRIIVVLIVGLLAWGCDEDKDATAAIQRDYLKAVLTEDLLEFAHLEVAGKRNVTLYPDDGNGYLGLSIFRNQKKVNSGVRAEVSVDYPFVPGETVHYSWRFKVRKRFKTDAPENRWWVIGQWHDQPNKTKGETWEGFPSNSPPVAFYLGELEGRIGFSMTYGPTNDAVEDTPLGPVFFERDVWQTVAITIHWSQNSDGFAKLYLNDLTTPVITANGPNMNNDYQHFLKVGMYRHPDVKTFNQILIDNIQITTVPPDCAD